MDGHGSAEMHRTVGVWRAMASRRDRMQIWTDILSVVESAREDWPPSRIQTRVNLPYGRFWRHIEEMQDRGLLEREPLRMTRDGQRFLIESAQLRRLLNGDEPA